MRFFHRLLASEANISLAQPQSMAERRAAAANAHELLYAQQIPLYVDTIDNEVFSSYAGRPMRIYLIDEQGIVVFEQTMWSYIPDRNALEEALRSLTAP